MSKESLFDRIMEDYKGLHPSKAICPVCKKWTGTVMTGMKVYATLKICGNCRAVRICENQS